MSKVHVINPKSREMLSDYANAVGALSTLCVANTEVLRSFLTNYYGVCLEQLSALHSLYFSRPLNLEDSDDINTGMDRVLNHFSASRLSTKEALVWLFPEWSQNAISSYSEQEAIYAYEMETLDQQIELKLAAEAEDRLFYVTDKAINSEVD